jgi:hypothetical protein
MFEGASGGRLTLTATHPPGSGLLSLKGKAEILGMTVRNAPTFGTILEEGGVGEAAAAVQGGGLTFDRIDIPFAYAEGVVTLDDAIARAPLLAVKVSGEVDEVDGGLDLVGVISPAYALTGVFNAIPVLGQILSGGAGEGILAMTFRVRGSLEDPRFTVNPLSLLTPGILRGVFSGRGGGGDGEGPSERFLEGLRPNN